MSRHQQYLCIDRRAKALGSAHEIAPGQIDLPDVPRVPEAGVAGERSGLRRRVIGSVVSVVAPPGFEPTEVLLVMICFQLRGLRG
jgi:hypothetical protein